MFFSSIVMSYKENCKAEGEIMTKFKIARMYFAGAKKQIEISQYLNCHQNTINNIIKDCKQIKSNNEVWDYLNNSKLHISNDKLLELFSFLKHDSRRPKSHKLSIVKDSEAEKLIIDKFETKNYGVKRLFKHLKRQKYDQKIYSLGKIKGVYKRKGFKTKKIRSANGERRPLYDYDEIEAFEFLQYDTKDILDMHAIPTDIYEKFQKSGQLPKIQWTIIDAKTKTRFLAWSYNRSSFFGFKFLEFTLNWLRAHNVQGRINIQMDMGAEFYSGSKRKQKEWNRYFKKYNCHVYDTEGVKWKQNIVERSHRIDDEEFYCPRGDKINNKTDFMVEGQFWIKYYNHRPSESIGLNGISPKEKLEELGVLNAEKICNFPCLILNDFFQPFVHFFNFVDKREILERKSKNVLTHYHMYQGWIQVSSANFDR
jgi:hypothetical protein